MKWFKKLWREKIANPNKETDDGQAECEIQTNDDVDASSKGGENSQRRPPRLPDSAGRTVCVKCSGKGGTCILCLGLNRRRGVINSGLKFCEQIVPPSSSSSEEEIDVVKKSRPIDIVLKRHAKELESLISSSGSSASNDDNREIIDPDEFFEDPQAVVQYKEQKLFDDWIIVGDDGEAIERQPSIVSFTDHDFDQLTEGHDHPPSVFYCCEHLDRGQCGLFKTTVLARGAKDKRAKRKSRDPRKSRRIYKKEAIAGSLMGPLRHRLFVDSNADLSQSAERNVIDYFGLNDRGDIVIHFDIVEETGFAFKKSNKVIYKNVKHGLEMSESVKFRLPLGLILKKVLVFLCKKLLCHPRNKTSSGGPGDSVEAYALSLASDRTSTFARNIENFISCTKDSRESTPQVVMRNMRQFMSGMKNYLVKHGEGDFAREVQMARSKLKPDEFLNLDTILEGVMHRLIVLPLREHLYALFVDYYTRSGDIQLLVENVKYAAGRTATEFGIRATVNPPKTAALRHISLLLLKLQEVELPLEKLDILLATITSIFDSTSGSQRGQALSADDFLPLLVYVVAKCGFIGAEIEAEYMWGLMQPSLLSGEAGYYLTALCSAVHVLKSFMTSDSDGTGSLDWRSSSLPACSSVLRVIIPDELNGSLQTRTLPVRPHTTTKEVCRIIAHKARITNPQDYGLFKLIDGEETALLDSECPQDARIAARGKHCILAYKRIDAKIAWPTSTACFQ